MVQPGNTAGSNRSKKYKSFLNVTLVLRGFRPDDLLKWSVLLIAEYSVSCLFIQTR